MVGGVVSKSTEGGKVTDAAVQSETVSALQNVASAVTTDTADQAMNIVESLELNAAVANLMQAIAKALLSDVVVGDTFESKSGANAISASKQSGSTIAGSKSSTAGSSIEFSGPPGDLKDDDVVGITGTKTETDPYGSCVKPDPSDESACSTTTYTLTVNGADYQVSGLKDLMYVDMESTDGARAVCQYFDESTGAWSTAGTYLHSYTATSIRCATSHLTTFAGFRGSSSAGSTVAVSLAALVALALAQLLAQ
jgi:hypothetical protein